MMWKFLILLFLAAFSCGEENDPTIVTVEQGQLRGKLEVSEGLKSFYSFRSIPFAEPPIGERRFEPAVVSGPWEGIRDAVADPPMCPQPDLAKIFIGGKLEFTGEEDCLYLNVFSPMKQVTDDSKGLLPVMVYIHGGAWFAGSATEFSPRHIMDHDVVYVALQYRLGTLGFLSTEDEVAPGNMGVLDQTLALKWVQQNAPAFGGNPLQVTIFGTSAGAFSTHLQVFSHTSLGFFQRAVMMSGTALSSSAVTTDHRPRAFAIAKHLRCHDANATVPDVCSSMEDSSAQYSCAVDNMSSQQILDCFKTKSTEELTSSAFIFSKVGLMPMVMTPRVHENFLMKSPEVLLKEGRYKKVDMMFGYCTDDGSVALLPILSSEATRSAVIHNFQELGPISLGMDHREVAYLNQTIKIFDHYAGNNNFEPEDVENLVKMYTDNMFWYGADTSAAAHSADPKLRERGRKVFMYEYAYRAVHSLVDMYPAAEVAQKWVGHADDLFPLFGEIFGGAMAFSAEDKALFRKFTSMMVSFATTGSPSWEGSEWQTYSKEDPRVMIIDGEAPNTATPKAEAREFWRSLPLRMNLALFPEEVKNVKNVQATPSEQQGKVEL